MDPKEAHESVLQWCHKHSTPHFKPCMRQRHPAYVADNPGTLALCVTDVARSGRKATVAEGDTWPEVWAVLTVLVDPYHR